MSEAINDGGSAFPAVQHTFHNGDTEYVGGGMSLRDWFAGKSLCGIMSSIGNRLINESDSLTPQEAQRQILSLATICYALSDAMLAEREKARKQ